MARQVVWSYEATADLDAIANYIARDSEFYAASFVQEIFDASYSLEMFGERGRVVPEFLDFWAGVNFCFKINRLRTGQEMLTKGKWGIGCLTSTSWWV